MSTTTSEPRRRLVAMDALGSDGVDPTAAARASVWLLRLALEHALTDLWAALGLGLAEASMRAQLLVLPKYLPSEHAWRLGELWRALSRAAHHHPYDLTPTRAEILTWRRGVESSVGDVEELVARRIL